MPKNINPFEISLPQSPPACPSCRRVCGPGAAWKGSNYCRGFILLKFIATAPGASAWELSQASGLAYADAARGLAKLRERGVVSAEREERSEGGFRYRHWLSGDDAAYERFCEMLRTVEARQ